MIISQLTFVTLLIGIMWDTVHSGCPSGWQDGVGMCYIPNIINSSDYVSWAEANAQCKRIESRGRLPVFKDAMSWNVFTMGVKQVKTQMVANSTTPPGPTLSDYIPFGAYKLKGEWYWLGGAKISDGFVNWQTGEPNRTVVNGENCVGFNPRNGDTGYRMIPSLTLSVGVLPSTISPPTASCPAGWDTIGGVCYKEPAPTPFFGNLTDAIAACTKLDPKAKLPEFHKFDDYDKFMRYVGANANADHQNITLGLQKIGNGYVDSDGSVYYYNFDDQEPKSGKNCVFMNDVFGYSMRTMGCTELGYIFCQIDTRSVTSVLPTTRPTTPTLLSNYYTPDVKTMNNFPSVGSNVNGSDASESALVSSLETFNKYLSQSYTEEEAFGHSVASQMKNFNAAMKSDVMYEIQRVLSMKAKEI